MAERGRIRIRVVGVLASGALALAGMAACSSAVGSPGTAAQVGSFRLTTAQVSSAVGDAVSITGTKVQAQQQYVTDEVYLQLLQKYAAQLKTPLPAPSTDLISGEAQRYQTQPTNKFAIAEATVLNDAAVLAAKTPAVTPTEDELKLAFDNAVSAGLVTPDSYADFKSAIVQVQGFGNYLGLQRQLTNIAKSTTIAINPRYQPACESQSCKGTQVAVLALSNGQNQFDSIVLQLGPSPTPAVVDLPSGGSTS